MATRQIGSAQDLLKRLSKGLRRATPPANIYHYTSAAGLIGILEGRAIWASSLRYLNDTREGQLALALAVKALDARLGSANAVYLRALHSVLKDAIAQAERRDAFVASFSENGDLLSQWRGYTPIGQGYAVGMAAAALTRPVGNEGPRHLTACIYDTQACEALTSRIIEEIIATAERERVFDPRSRDRAHKECFGRFVELLSLIAPSVKDSAFQEEAEWRLIAAEAAFESPHPRFRVGRSTLVPYYSFRLAGEGHTLPLTEVVVGPTPHPDLSRQATEALLASQGLASTSVRVSEVPYRSW